jgi:hypothetical protein
VTYTTERHPEGTRSRVREGPYEAFAVAAASARSDELHAEHAILYTSVALHSDVRSLSSPLSAGAFGMTRVEPTIPMLHITSLTFP